MQFNTIDSSTDPQQVARGIIKDYCREWDDFNIESEWLIDQIAHALREAEQRVWKKVIDAQENGINEGTRYFNVDDEFVNWCRQQAGKEGG